VQVPFCRVEATLEGDINIEVWLPRPEHWQGRLLGAGVGGSAGYLNYSDMARGLPLGFAGATTDTGHRLNDNEWMMDQRKLDNYSHRAQHLLAVAAKAIVAAYYGRAPDHAYFIGCSGGGRQALKQAQKYPDDYEGIIAGAPGPNMNRLSARHLWAGLYGQAHPADVLSNAEWDQVEAAVTEKCDALDGVKDGLIGNPLRCRFDPASLDCARGGKPCLPANKVAFVKAMYAPLRDETGQTHDTGLLPGVRTRPGPPPPAAAQTFGQSVHHDAHWDAKNFRMADDLPASFKAAPELRADNPDLDRFKARGGKLILYSGWMDPSVIVGQTLGYYESVRARFGKATGDFTRLYLAPGVYHCGGGPGPDRFGGMSTPSPIVDADHDLLLALTNWVEMQRPPRSIIAVKVEHDAIVRSLPLCPYPQQARYDGKGDVKSAHSFVCR
jgi:feruloyl esterase